MLFPSILLQCGLQKTSMIGVEVMQLVLLLSHPSGNLSQLISEIHLHLLSDIYRIKTLVFISSLPLVIIVTAYYFQM